MGRNRIQKYKLREENLEGNGNTFHNTLKGSSTDKTLLNKRLTQTNLFKFNGKYENRIIHDDSTTNSYTPNNAIEKNNNGNCNRSNNNTQNYIKLLQSNVNFNKIKTPQENTIINLNKINQLHNKNQICSNRINNLCNYDEQLCNILNNNEKDKKKLHGNNNIITHNHQNNITSTLYNYDNSCIENNQSDYINKLSIKNKVNTSNTFYNIDQFGLLNKKKKIKSLENLKSYISNDGESFNNSFTIKPFNSYNKSTMKVKNILSNEKTILCRKNCKNFILNKRINLEHYNSKKGNSNNNDMNESDVVKKL